MPHPTPQTEPIAQIRFSCSSRVRFFPGEGEQRSGPRRNFGVGPSRFLQRRAPLRGVSGWRGAVEEGPTATSSLCFSAGEAGFEDKGCLGTPRPASRAGGAAAHTPPRGPCCTPRPAPRGAAAFGTRPPFDPGGGARGTDRTGGGSAPGGLPERRRRRSSGSGNSRPRAFTSPGVKAGPLPRPLP